MATSINGILDSAKRALIAQQYAIQVTGHNIANVNTKGYSRQRVNLASSLPVDSLPGQLGTGVKPEEVQRFRDLFIDFQLRRESQSLGRFEAENEALQMVESILNEPNDFALSGVMNNFWNSWEDLSNDPTSESARTVVQQAAVSMAQTFHQLHRDLEAQQYNLSNEIGADLSDLNAAAANVAELNSRIVRAESKGQHANDLRDVRDNALDEIASLINTSWQEQENGSVTVYVGGMPLVEYDTVKEISQDRDSTTGRTVLFFADSGVEAPVDQGSLAGHIEVRDVKMPEYIRQLDETAVALATAVNELHLTGVDLNGDDAGLFFADGCEGAASLMLDFSLADDVNLIAVSLDGNTGDGALGLDMAALRTAENLSLDGKSISNHYNSLISKIGSDSASSARQVEQQETFVTTLENYRQSVSGVSIDEEMSNMILYEQAYQAAAKLIRVADEMLWTVINLK
jgi:flagellar hook-associated protein 1 FlgK